MRLAMTLILSFFACAGAAQDGDDESAGAVAENSRDPDRCVRTRSIRRTQVIDDQTIVFFMRNRDIYVNTLQRQCPQLAHEARFAYEARGGNLCDTDLITVMLQFAGRFEPGFTCRLGQFVPADQETVDLIIAAAKDGGAAPPVSAEPVELPVEDEAEAEAADTQAGDTL
jgi:hypothetical protein